MKRLCIAIIVRQISMLQALGQTVGPQVDIVVVLCSRSSMPYLARCCRGGRCVEQNSFKM